MRGAGKSACIICPDADVDEAVRIAHDALFFNHGMAIPEPYTLTPELPSALYDLHTAHLHLQQAEAVASISACI